MNLYEEVRIYLVENQDKPIYQVYKELKEKKKKSKSEQIVYTYLKLNKKKLGIK